MSHAFVRAVVCVGEPRLPAGGERLSVYCEAVILRCDVALALRSLGEGGTA